jgi:transcriptional regulator with XRE-family HTH domain
MFDREEPAGPDLLKMQEDDEALEFQRRIGANVRQWRLQRALTLEDFARRCAKPMAAVDQIESGATMASLEFLWRAAHVLGVSCLVLTDQQEDRSAA